MQKTIIANWKMNGSLAFIDAFIPSLTAALSISPHRLMICPPFPYLSIVGKALAQTSASLGAQNCSPTREGAFTGEVSAAMLADLGCKAVILGHSERRSLFGETDDLVKAKAAATHEAGLTAIVCVGETLAVRKGGKAIQTVIQQVEASLPDSATSANTMIAYEPIWAIGTGLTPALAEIQEMHQALPTDFSLVYGGSVTDQNAKDILNIPRVEGVLVGGASLKAETFRGIVS